MSNGPKSLRNVSNNLMNLCMWVSLLQLSQRSTLPKPDVNTCACCSSYQTWLKTHIYQFHNCHKCQNEPRLDANKSTIFFICYIALCPVLYFTWESKVRPEFKCQPSPFQCASTEWEWLQGYSNHGRKNVLPWPELQRMEWPAVHLYSAVSLGGATD